MNVTDEAVEAAVVAFWAKADTDPYHAPMMRAALEAAAPYMTVTRPGIGG